MCIIVYKPTFEKMPKYDILKNCFDNNPDGSGFMFIENNRVHIKKGFMNFDDFYYTLKDYKKIWEKSPFVLHFRISTQGGTRTDLTHPFPLSHKMKHLRKLDFITDIGIAHNGIIYLTSTYTKNIDYSDTMSFITEYLSLLIKRKDYYKDGDTLKLIKKLCGSKLAILDRNGHCELIGDFIHDNGIYYSNSSYSYSYSYYKKSKNNNDNSSTIKPYSFDYCFDNDLNDLNDDDDYLTNYYTTKEEIKANLHKDCIDYWNSELLKYEFDEYACPLLKYGSYTYCEDCVHYDTCY